MVDVSDGSDIPNHITISSGYNFFTKNVEYNPSIFIADDFSISQLPSTDVFDQSKDYKSTFVLETEQEKQLFK